MRQGLKGISDRRNHMNKGMKICNCVVTARNYKHFHITGISVGPGNEVDEFGKVVGHEGFRKSF